MAGNLRAYVAGAVILQGGLALGACNNAQPVSDAPVRAQAETARPVAVSGPKRLILAFGDSLYAGYRLAPGEGLPAEIEQRLRARGIDATVVGAGVSGDTTAAGRQRLAFTLDRLERKPDLVVLGLGGNDLLRQIALAETRANLTAMLEELRRRDIPVVLTGMLAPPNLGPDYARGFNALWPELAKRYGAALDPFILDGVIGDRRYMLPDGIHPNAAGVDRIGARLAPIVASRLEG